MGKKNYHLKTGDPKEDTKKKGKEPLNAVGNPRKRMLY